MKSSFWVWNALYPLNLALSSQVVAVQATRGASIFAFQHALAMGVTMITISSSDKKNSRPRYPWAQVVCQIPPKRPHGRKKGKQFTNGKGANNVVDIGAQSPCEESFNAI